MKNKMEQKHTKKRRKILLIDDDVDFAYLNKVFLESKGYQVIISYDGEGGIKKARQTKPDLVILDVMMSRMTEGFDVARELKADEELNNIPIIMLTAIRKKEKLPWTFEPDDTWLPVNRFLEKPISLEKLLEEIEKIIK
ncbi:MAG TPA: response regulator [Candidatus Aerophobetes bacterium]|nr:response regulator [Candidatus Aerophobetes bacterium]